MRDTSPKRKVIDRRDCWSIGIYSGENPVELQPVNDIQQPVLRYSDITDINADFVADPFVIRRDEEWYMFFEVYNHDTQLGEIGLAQSLDGLHWEYSQIVIREPWHLSYPYTFEWEGEHYMIPETLSPGAIRLYKSTSFPESWVYEKDLLQGSFADSSVINYDGYWYLFTCATPYEHDCLRLYTAQTLHGVWSEHPMSPIIQGDKDSARPGGRVVEYKDNLIRYAQNCLSEYGKQLHAFLITIMDPLNYKEHPLDSNPVLEPGGDDWRELRMHHADPHQIEEGEWLVYVDAMRNIRKHKAGEHYS